MIKSRDSKVERKENICRQKKKKKKRNETKKRIMQWFVIKSRKHGGRAGLAKEGKKYIIQIDIFENE